MRVVSLVPSVTETLLAWGVEVVACTRFCEQPTLRHVGGTKDPDLAAIISLAPDLVVVDREENRREDAEALLAAGVPLHVTHVVDLAGVAPMLAGLTAATGATGASGASGATGATGATAAAGASSGNDPAATEWGAATPTWASAFVPIWRRPWMGLGVATYGSSVLAHLGVRNVLTDDDGTYPEIDLAEVARRAPSFVLLPSEPYPFAERHLAEVSAALPDARVLLLDGRDLFWWGVRTAGALTRLREVLQPSG